MSAPIIAFFNNKGGVGKTSLVYHLSWMYADIGLRALAADLDPQANLSASLLDEEQLERVWSEESDQTIYSAIRPLLEGTGGLASPNTEPISENLSAILGDLELSRFEADLSFQWNQLAQGQPRPFVYSSVFWKLMRDAASRHRADIVLADLGPNLGAINRAALIAADFVVIPLAPDLYSLQGIRNLGPTFQEWREYWQRSLNSRAQGAGDMPRGTIEPIGYVVLQHAERLSRPTKAYAAWAARIPQEYRKHVLGRDGDAAIPLDKDPHNLASIKHYRSLMPLAHEARKPIFHLKPADGAIGAHATSARDAYQDFLRLARRIADRAGVGWPAPP